MGSLSLRTLGLHWALGLDLGRRRTLGIRTFPLRPLGFREQWMVLGAGAGGGASGLGARAGGVCRRRAWVPLLSGSRRGVVSAGARRSLCARISREPHLRE